MDVNTTLALQKFYKERNALNMTGRLQGYTQCASESNTECYVTFVGLQENSTGHLLLEC